jgi:hypothetical protein
VAVQPMSRGMCRLVGRTADGYLVFTGLYQLYETTGMPLDFCIAYFYERKIMPCWTSLYKDGVKAGAKPARWIRTIRDCIADGIDSHMADAVSKRLTEMFMDSKKR